MNRDDFETLLGSVAAQYEEAYTREIEALRHENRAEYDVLASRVSLLTAAYDAGEIGGRNAEIRSLQKDGVLLASGVHAALVGLHSRLVTVRKAATAERIGIEHEIKLWRAWLASQRSDE